MKKLLLVLIVFCIAGVSLFAWEPADLTKFPLGQNEKNWILNLGIGLPTYVKSYYMDEFVSIPPLRLSFDKNVGMGNKKLPFFIGGVFGYQGYGYSRKVYNWDKRVDEKKTYFYHDLSIGGRFGYHFNWGVNNLDTYAVTTIGWTIHSGDYITPKNPDPGVFLYGVNIGARYFVSKGFGFWIEGGFNAISFLDIGLAFKF